MGILFAPSNIRQLPLFIQRINGKLQSIIMRGPTTHTLIEANGYTIYTIKYKAIIIIYTENKWKIAKYNNEGAHDPYKDKSKWVYYLYHQIQGNHHRLIQSLKDLK
jgi:hypothetical protein